ncbi:ribonuclease Z, mitochondrial-like [Artemia franciscana]
MFRKACFGIFFRSYKTMAKDIKYIAEIKAKRLAKKQWTAGHVPGKIYFQVIGNGSKGSPKSVYFYTDQNKYLFNCGEGTQRLTQEHRMRFAKLENIFLTSLHWDNIGGLPGACLTAQEMGNAGLTVHGPYGSDLLFQSADKILILNELNVLHSDCLKVVQETEKYWHFEDPILKVRYIPVKSQKYTQPEHREPPLAENFDRYIKERNFRRYDRDASPPSPKKQRFKNSPQEDFLQLAICYECSIQPKPGALRSELCVDLGVPAGPLYGQLKSGNDVALPDGRIVRSKDVCSPEEPGATFLIVECPNETFLDNFLSVEDFTKYQAKDKNLDFIIHFTPDKIVNREEYKKFMSAFPESTYHILLSGSKESSGYLGVNRAQCLLNLLDSNVFPYLNDTGMRTNLSESDAAKSGQVVNGESCLKYHLRPPSKFDWESVPVLKKNEVISEALEVPGFTDALRGMNNQIEQLGDLHPGFESHSYPKITFLGTGSCIPNKTRNVSCILTETSENLFFMMDCGEGSLGQLIRFFGVDHVDQVLCNLKCIFISHFHADHHLGLFSLLLERRAAFLRLGKNFESLVLILPVNLERWLLRFNERFHRIEDDYDVIWSEKIQPHYEQYNERKAKNQPSYLKLKKSLNLDVATAYVKHCFLAFGITISHENGWKMTYSGDTMFSPELIEVGKGSDILIHESTMEDDLEEEARVKQHSTTSQAIAVGKEMKAKYTLLTHFSQRYAKLPIIEDTMDEHVGIAFDNMTVCPKDLPKLHLFVPPLKLVYHEYYKDMEEKTAKKLKSKEIMGEKIKELEKTMKTKTGFPEDWDDKLNPKNQDTV